MRRGTQYSDSLALRLQRRQGSTLLREPGRSQGRLTKGCCSDNQRTHQTQKDARAERVQDCESGEAGEGGGGEADVQGGAQVAGLGTVLRGSDFVLHAVGSQRMVPRGCEVSRPVISERAGCLTADGEFEGKRPEAVVYGPGSFT